MPFDRVFEIGEAILKGRGARPGRRRDGLTPIEPIADLVEAGPRASVVELAAGAPAAPMALIDLVAELDRHAAAEEHHMRQFAERRDAVLALGALGSASVSALNEAAV